jgi:LAO/AO transport system kinase
MVTMAEPANAWRPRVIKTIATTGDGIAALAEAINQHAEHTRRSSTREMSEDKLREEILDAAKRYFDDIKLKEIESSKDFTKMVSRVKTRHLDPYTAARALMERN